MAVAFVNNSLRPKEAVIIINSFKHQLSTLTHLNLSKNNLGLPGANCLDDLIQRMRSIKQLHLAECSLSDRGVAAIVARLEDSTALDVLDLSGNQIGQSSYYKDSAAALVAYI
mmetsp:Transcript_24955/g.33431  ORF Transcript_24955/g.33431 Transcript_24955/m.33431 type:complete len:113 (-) Transcript_24955:2125-2463(-)